MLTPIIDLCVANIVKKGLQLIPFNHAVNSSFGGLTYFRVSSVQDIGIFLLIDVCSRCDIIGDDFRDFFAHHVVHSIYYVFIVICCSELNRVYFSDLNKIFH